MPGCSKANLAENGSEGPGTSHWKSKTLEDDTLVADLAHEDIQ